MDPGKEIIPALNDSLQLSLANELSNDQLLDKLAEHINFLIGKDFQKLISILYRVDISEKKLKTMLDENQNTDAGKLIASLLIERQLQKIKTRREFSRRDNNIDENEKW